MPVNFPVERDGGAPSPPSLSPFIPSGFPRGSFAPSKKQVQINMAQDFILQVGIQWVRFSGIPIDWKAHTLAELAVLLEELSGMTLEELAVFLSVPKPKELVGTPLIAIIEEGIQFVLDGFLAFIGPESLSLGGSLEPLAALLVNPPRAPGEPCIAPAPLLRDLLDVALGRPGGGIGAIFETVGGVVEDLLLPGFVIGEELTQFVQAILDDPITAALNLVLGQQNQLDCVVEAGLGVAGSVIEAGIERISEVIAGALA